MFLLFSPTLVSLFLVFPTFGAFQGETQLMLFVNFVHFVFKVILEHKTNTHLYQSTVATVIQHNSTKHPWHSTISICSSCCVYTGGGLTQSEGARWGQLPAEAHGFLIFLLGPIDWACSSHRDAEVKTASRTIQGFLLLHIRAKHYCLQCFVLLTKAGHVVKHKANGKEISSTSFTGRITEAHSKRCVWRKRWRTGAFASIYTIYHTACLIFLRFLKFRDS